MFPDLALLIHKEERTMYISDDYWSPIFCFLSFNLFAFLGNFVSQFIRVPGHRWVWIPVLIRGLLIPFFLLCNFKPEDRTFDVIISNDYIFIVGGILTGFTSGYYSSLCMMYGPKLVEQQYAGTAGMIMAFFLVLGIGTGVNFSLALGMIFTNPKV